MNMIDHCTALTVAGSDSGGGAGIQADLKTFSHFGVFGASVITAITAQNLQGVTAIQAVDTEVVRKQLTAVLEGFPVKAVKTGMLFSADIIRTVAEVLAGYPGLPIIADPVFAATSGSPLIEENAVEALTEQLFPLAALITPNIPEAEILTGETLNSPGDLEQAGRVLFDRFGVPLLMKGGHLDRLAVDVLVDGAGSLAFQQEFIEGVNSHGSGCTLASAIAAAAARGQNIREAVESAKDYITRTLQQPVRLSPSLAVMNHFPAE